MKILMVCLGNICRSPMAEGILSHKATSLHLPVTVDSAGTGNYHVGESPDDRAIATAGKFGVDISGQQARQFTVEDFDRFDHIFVMDTSNRRNVLQLAEREEHRAKVRLMMDVLYPNEEMEVPDPWFGGQEGFVRVFEMLDTACDRFLTDAKDQLKRS
jgi:protein-tyrosine phosphatase